MRWPGRLGCALLIAGLAGAYARAHSEESTGTTCTNLNGEVAFQNARVLVQRFVLAPGEASGPCRRSGDQLLVFTKGGTLKSSSGRRIVWQDGRVVWGGSMAGAGEGSNVGATPIEMLWVSLKPVSAVPSSAHARPKYRYLSYPNIPGEDLLENDFVIVQRFLVQPGQWEGVHAHHPDMLFIHVKGGQWAVRSKHEAEHAYPNATPDGEVGWEPVIDISEGHESGNVGKNPIDLIWVTLKK